MAGRKRGKVIVRSEAWTLFIIRSMILYAVASKRALKSETMGVFMLISALDIHPDTLGKICENGLGEGGRLGVGRQPLPPCRSFSHS